MYSDILNRLHNDESEDIISDMLVQGYKAYSEGILDGAKTVVGAARTGARNLTTTKNKIGSSDLVQAVKNACGKLLNMLQNLIKSIFNGTNKLKKLIKDIENQERKFTVQQDGKQKKVIKTITIRNLIDMGFSNQDPKDDKDAFIALKKNGGMSIYTYYYRFSNMMKDGSKRAKMDFSSKEKSIKSLNEVARPNLRNNTDETQSTEDYTGNILKKWKLKPNDDVTKVMSSGQFGQMIQELYGYGYAAGTSEFKQFKGMSAKYFKQPLTTKIDNTDGKAFSIVKGSLEFVKNAGKVLIQLDADAYMKAELEEIKRAQRDLEKLNRENVKGAQDAEDRQNGETVKTDVNNVKDGDATFFGDKRTVDKSNNDNNGGQPSGQKESIDLYLIRQALSAFGEDGEPDNNQGSDNSQGGGDTGNNNTQPAETSDNGASTKDAQDSILDGQQNNHEVKKTNTATGSSEIKGIFEYIQAFLINYAIAIQKTMNYYNAFIMNLVLAGQQLLNDLATLGKATNGGE